MILRSLGESPASAPDSNRSAWHFVEQAQERASTPLLLIPQPAHAVLAGELARAFVPEAFGQLPESILQAIRMHDTGWGLLDAAQIHSLRGGDKAKSAQQGKKNSATVSPVSFLKTSPADTVAAWRSSIEETQKIAPECGYIVSRHFTLLTLPDDPAHSAFRKQEKARQETLLKSASLNLVDLERWVDALGFSDLLSLVLCSGEQADVLLPKAHPARKSTAPALRVQVEGEKVILPEPLIPAGTEVEIDGLMYPAPPAGSAAHPLRWIFV
jgi:Protein of unknown function (DUF3891)